MALEKEWETEPRTEVVEEEEEYAVTRRSRLWKRYRRPDDRRRWQNHTGFLV